MPSKIIWISLALIIALIASGCATQLPVKKDPQDCLVLIKTTMQNETSHKDARIYKLFLSDRKKPILVTGYDLNFVFVVIKQPGVILEKVVSEVDQSQNYFGPTIETDVDFDLPYQPGKLLIADFALTRQVKVNKNGIEGSSTSSWNIRALSEEEVQVLRSEALKIKNSESWM